MAMTHILVVSDITTSIRWYQDVLGASLFREYGGTSAVFDFNGAWLLLVTGGESEDKPGVELAPPDDPDRMSHLVTIRVPDCQAAYEELHSRGATFLTPPHDWGTEVRCFFRDPDAHLFEISSLPASASR